MDIEIKSFCLPETYSVSITAFFVILQAMPVITRRRNAEIIRTYNIRSHSSAGVVLSKMV